MFSRIKIQLTPSHGVGGLAALPWLTLACFLLIVATQHGPMTLIALIAALPAIAGAVYQYELNGRLRLPRSVTELCVTDQGLRVQLRNGEEHLVSPAADSRLYSRLAILKLHQTGSTNRTCTVLLCSAGKHLHNVQENDFRRLRVWLRLGSATNSPSPQKTH